MPYIHCCSELHSSRSYIIVPCDGYIYSKLLVLESCPTCKSYKIELIRVNYKCEVITHTLKNKKARKLFDKLKGDILFEEKNRFKINGSNSKYYLNYTENGRIKKCFSNLSALKIGLFEEKFIEKEKRII